jgi:hypothetical protein
MESGNRTVLDCSHFALTFIGLGTGAAGIVTGSVAIAVFGLLLSAFGLAYFALGESRQP